MSFLHSPIIDRRHGHDRRLDCHGCPASGAHLGTRARMLAPLIAVLSISVVFAAGWVAGQARISERRIHTTLDTIIPVQFGPPAPIHPGVVR